MKIIRSLAWVAPLLLQAADAHAWGLYTHMYFAQLLVWALPLADDRLRRAVRRFPELCFAGTCLPDISLFTRLIGVPALGGTHQWSAVSNMLRTAGSDEERALCVGYASHLLTDIVAHNYFVPAHDALWFRGGMATHAGCEWAMDAHIAPHLFVRPALLIERHGDTLARYAGERLGCVPAGVSRALYWLMRGERALRASRLPQMIYHGAKRLDPGLAGRFDDYIRETSTRLGQLDRLACGEVPAWLPEPLPDATGRDTRSASSSAIHHASLLPADFFRRTFR